MSESKVQHTPPKPLTKGQWAIRWIILVFALICVFLAGYWFHACSVRGSMGTFYGCPVPGPVSMGK